jgi:hypothetical protein
MSAAVAQQKQAQRRQKRVREETIQDVPVGGICLIPIDRVDRSKVDPKCLPFVIVDVTPPQQYPRLQSWCTRYSIIPPRLPYEEKKLQFSMDNKMPFRIGSHVKG